MGDPWKFQVMRGAGFPWAEHWKRTGEWRCVVWETGDWVMVGGSAGVCVVRNDVSVM